MYKVLQNTELIVTTTIVIIISTGKDHKWSNFEL